MTGNRNAKLVVERYLLTKIMNKPTKAYINEKKHNNNNNNNNKQMIVYGYLTFYYDLEKIIIVINIFPFFEEDIQ